MFEILYTSKPDKKHFVGLNRSKVGSRKRLNITYEEMSLFPSSSLLKEFHSIEHSEYGHCHQICRMKRVNTVRAGHFLSDSLPKIAQEM